MIRVQTIFPRPKFNNFSHDTVPLNQVPKSFKEKSSQIIVKLIKKSFFLFDSEAESQLAEQNLF